MALNYNRWPEYYDATEENFAEYCRIMERRALGNLHEPLYPPNTGFLYDFTPYGP
jgi:hypothetical protein